MTGKLDFNRSLCSAAWALARVSCVGLLFLGTTNCLPAPSDNNGGSSGGGNSSAGGNGGNVTPQGGTTHAPTGGSTYVSVGGSTYVQGGSSYVPPIGGTSSGGSSYVPPQGGTPEGGTTTTPPMGGTTSLPPVGGTTSLPPVGGTTSLPPVGGTTSTPPVGGSTAVTTCTPVPKSTGGISCPNGKCVSGTYTGYDFTYSDGKTSSICLSANSLCAAGVTGAQDPPAYSVYGAGFGFNLSPDTTLTSVVELQLSGSGVSIAVTSLPTGADLRIQTNVGGADYCAKMTTATQTIPWTTFNTKCWDNTGTALAGAPKTAKIEFQASSLTTAGSFDFCVTSVSFQ
jgi:hypothetical protein